ncbi:class I SAM-dependent methyltransferase [uncultured Alistipes sp.]|uniref:class I SAM-dependent methyltransferase n=1 Tax=uncultured Alistipes sp. TaxID=538949 RepID=UPI002622F78A|nr:class I SAM-dependent methyltransferase [uncultured Alistipes sp.]
MFDLARSRASEREQLRIADLMSLTPPGDRVLEIGARDCYLSRRLSDLYREVVALDLQRPVVDHPGIVPVQGDVTDLRFGDGTFDTVFCTEVLEHVPPEKLVRACDEIERTTSRYAVIGVPYRQDLRADRTLCRRCGTVNPATGHLNRFDRRRLEALFPRMRVVEARLTGQGRAVTNPLSVWLFRLCGYPYGSYDQEEGCIRCGAPLERPKIGPGRWALCFVARTLNRMQFYLYGRRRPIWIHLLFEKCDSAAPAAPVASSRPHSVR